MAHIGWDGRTRTYEMPESKSGALPTWLHPIGARIELAGVEGLEPPNAGIRIRCLTNLATPQNTVP